MDNYNYIQINDENYSFTKILYRKSFGVDHSITDIKRKYNTSVFGHKNIGYFAVTESSDPASYYGVFPMIMTINAKDVPVAQSGDTMTAPEHRNKGLFVKLAKMTYQLAEKQGIQFVFGFPNENSFPGFQKKLAWQFFGSMQKFSIINLVIPLCEISNKFKALAKSYAKYCNLRLSKYKIEVTEQNIAPFNIIKPYGSVKKDLNFFNYKLYNPENHLIIINGFTLLIKSKTHLFIGETGYFEKNKTMDYIKTLKKLAAILGCRTTVIIVSTNHWLFDYLRSYLDPVDNLPIGFLTFNEDISFEKITFTQADYDTF